MVPERGPAAGSHPPGHPGGAGAAPRGVLRDLAANPIYWLLVATPALLIAHKLAPNAHTALFVFAIVAIVPLAALLSHATESVAARTGDAVGGLLNATLGNLTELVIAITALRAGMLDLVKASITDAVVTNSLFMLGGAFLVGGFKNHVQDFNPRNARVQSAMLLLATIGLLIPSAVVRIDTLNVPEFIRPVSLAIAVVLLATYSLSLLFSLKTHKELFGAAGEAEHEPAWPVVPSVVALVAATICIAVVSEIFVGSVQEAALSLGMSKAFVGFIVVSLVGAAAEMTAAFSAAAKNRLDLSVGIAMGSSSQIALFVAPVLLILSYFIAPTPMDLSFSGGQVLMVLFTTLAVSQVVAGGHAAWFSGVQLLAVYAAFAVTLYLLPR